MILHIMADSAKHINYPFIEFVNKNFNKNEHLFILCSAQKDIQKFENAITKDIFTQEKFFIENMKKADKIILHGFWYDKIFEIYKKYLVFFEKTIWRPWGGEYYFNRDKNSEWFIQNIKYIVHFMKEEYLYIKNKYHTKAKFYELLIYDLYSSQANIFLKKNNKKILIQVGNSADPSNRHLEIFMKLKKFNKIKVFSPLVYGDKNYKEYIIMKGRNLFKSDFLVLEKSLLLREYIELLNSIDIACFNHKRQQALGNMITLMILGKKVFLNHRVTSWKFFNRIGLKVFNINRNIKIDYLNKIARNRNKRILNNFFSQKKIKFDLDKLFRMSLD